MDGLARLALASVLAGCGAPTVVDTGAVSGVTVVARGSLAYAVGWAGDRLVTIELAERFELVVRAPDMSAELARSDLGPPEDDLGALAVIGEQAWIGGEDGHVRGLALADGAVIADWPIGEPVTGLAVDADHVAIATGTGALCLRRRADGALLQCVDAGAPITALAIRDQQLAATTAAATTHWTLPALRREPDGAAAAPITAVVEGRVAVARAQRVEWQDGGLIVEMAGPVHGLAGGPGGALAVAAWIRALDQPSVVIVETRP